MKQTGANRERPETAGAAIAAVDNRAVVRACFVLAPRFTLLAFAGFLDSLRHAADVGDMSRQVQCRWSIATREGRPATASCGAEIGGLDAAELDRRHDYVIVVGGLLPDCLELGGDLYAFLHAARGRGATLVGLCTGGFILAEAGLMAHRKCCVHLAHKPDLEAMYPDVRPVTEETYILDGDIITCPGGTAAIDLAAEIISRHFGKARALKGLRAMLVDRHRAAHHLPSRSYERLATCGNPHVERAIKLMEMNIGQHRPIKDIARGIGISKSQLDRVFARQAGMRPTQFWRKMRLEHAHWMICNTSKTMTNIAYECGFHDSAHFARRFREAYGQAPRALRERNRAIVNLRHDGVVI